jgi:hypothetical protein
MRWKGYNHLSMQKPATASVECKVDVGKRERFEMPDIGACVAFRVSVLGAGADI